jgi:CheY-like chemotaxis protein
MAGTLISAPPPRRWGVALLRLVFIVAWLRCPRSGQTQEALPTEIQNSSSEVSTEDLLKLRENQIRIKQHQEIIEIQKRVLASMAQSIEASRAPSGQSPGAEPAQPTQVSGPLQESSSGAIFYTAVLLFAAGLVARRFSSQITEFFSAHLHSSPRSVTQTMATETLPTPNETFAPMEENFLPFKEIALGADGLEPMQRTAAQQPGASQAEATVNQVARFFRFAPAELVDVQRLLQEASRSDDATARQKMLLQLCERLRYLCYSLRHPELRSAWQIAVCVEGLLQKLARSSSIVTTSALRTAACGLEVLRDLCAMGDNLLFATDNAARLLVVDDDAVSRFAISAALRKAFNPPELAPDGETGLSLATRQTYDAIFLDVEMPGMDGFELCTKIHETQLNPTTPVVFVTQHSDFESRAKAAENGGHDLIGKPFVPLEITLKAFTLVLRSRLERRDGNLQSTAKDFDTDPQPKPLGSIKVPESTGSERCSGMKPLCDGRRLGNEEPRPAPVLPRRDVLTHREGLVPFQRSSRGSALNGTSDQSSQARDIVGGAKATPHDYASALYTFAPDHLVQLKGQLQAASEAEDSALRQELLGELYVGVHSLTSEAERAELNAFHRLGSALEALLRKLLERSDSCTPSTLEAGTAALSLLDELCRSKVEPVLDEPPVRILVVDDDPIARRALAGAIQVIFDRPETADCGEAALTLVDESPFDLILLDVLMPGMDGFTTCAKIRQSVHNEPTPVVFVTSQSDLESRRQGAIAGGCGFIPKPFLAAEITVTVLTFALRGRLAKLKPSASYGQKAPAASR